MNDLIKILLIAAAIFALSYYDYSIHGDEYQAEKLSRKYWKLGYVEVDSILNGRFYATNITDTVYGINYKNALPEGRDLKIGDLISIKGKHIENRTVNIDFIHFHDGRIWKILISVLPVLIIVWFFFKYFKFDTNKLRFTKR